MTDLPSTARAYRTRWRRRLATVTVAVATAALGAGSASAADTGSSAAKAAYPVTIKHKFGSTTLTSKPKRVVLVGLIEQDAMLALGEVPVATTEWFGKHKGAIFPWAKDELANGKYPTVLKDADGMQFEKIKALHPDAIVGLYSGMKKSDYDTLSKIAPTIAQTNDYVDYGVPWQVATQTVGKVVGKSAQAEKLIAGIEKRFAAVRKSNPKFVGASAVIAAPYQGIWVYGPEDVRSRVLESLGFKLPKGLGSITGTEFGANLSKERTDLLDVDAIVWLATFPKKDAATLGKDKLYSSLAVHTEGREVFIGDNEPLGGAFSFVSVLSLPYMLDNFVPLMKRAIDGDPSTVVRST
jgi:iron complex transport system substrate-binding protein